MPKPSLILKDPVANREWNRHKARLVKAGKWSDQDEAEFAILVHSYAKWLKVSERLAAIAANPDIPDSGMILVNVRKGTTYRNPLLDVQAQLQNTIFRACDHFGFNPLARARMNAINRCGGEPELPFGAEDELMNGPPADPPPPAKG